MKKLLTIIAIIALTNTAVANNTTPIELKVVNTTTVQVKTTVVAKANETYTIERSYDNKTFTQVGLILGTEDAAGMPPLKLNDKINTSATKAYYRIVKQNDDGSTTIVGTNTIEIGF